MRKMLLCGGEFQLFVHNIAKISSGRRNHKEFVTEADQTTPIGGYQVFPRGEKHTDVLFMMSRGATPRAAGQGLELTTLLAESEGTDHKANLPPRYESLN